MYGTAIGLNLEIRLYEKAMYYSQMKNNRKQLGLVSILISVSLILSSSPNSYGFEVEGSYAEVNYTIKVDAEEYYINFYACSPEKTIEFTKIWILTDLESMVLTYPMIMTAGTCHTFESLINAKSLNSIKISLVE
jgi:hypothetical protein